jgi:cytochrome c
MKLTALVADMIRRWMAVGVIVLLALAPSLVAGAPAKPPASLTDYRCYVCHSDREAMVGPAFADIAAFYRGRQDAVSKIAGDIRAGIRGGSPWHMPPHPEVSGSEARAMARYIMSLDPKNAAPQEVNRR